ncbi:hypothetical protein CFP56_030945 [Quercus suber]|uniref:Uncharacterized protein n=1 Tax=Quercus suber TaxID=58331 RepID=A0AAW0JLQ2_QUESU
MATLPRDFDDFSNQLEEGEIHDTLQQCGRMAYSCFNWTVTITMNLPLEKIHLFTKLLTVHPPIKSYLLSWPHLEARALCSKANQFGCSNSYKSLTVHPPIKSYLLSWPHLEARALCSSDFNTFNDF